ncbi:MAG: shikimate dehydrogenase [Hydrogenophaga sp.]|jgi:shikimate dehydrogenase|uniref:shikimate dehydrogenase family protein n=1 Tax=Hydrogenophaga sp. TaxID=1904254 RepID=UPI001D9A3D37|nr:shikimate dehydrogenase [Hydrogenophaga sp.]MBW0172652.1 shikimate dehydrogenase [Hydrogenophaga sp.]MBW0186353.1 shikimate dehydrogenase [Hydrogenophaga sp.]
MDRAFCIDGNTELIAHIGHPTHAFKAPLIYNPHFEAQGINAVVVPMACRADDFARFLRAVFALENVRGALITMPHKVHTVGLLDEASPAVHVAGACNAVRRDTRGRLVGEQFDGAGFVRGIQRKGFDVRGRTALVVGAGGVGCAIAASLAGAGVGALRLIDENAALAERLRERLALHHPEIGVSTGSRDPRGCDLVVNATPLGMNDGDPLPFDVSLLAASTWVGEVVMRREVTPLLAAAQARGCRVQVGTDMLFEQIPAYLEFFGFPSATPQALRATARQPADG